jgi:hypothetical protein
MRVADIFSKLRRGTIAEAWERLQPFRAHMMAIGVALIIGMIAGVIKASTAPAKPANVDRWAMPQWAPYQAAATRQEMSGSVIFTPDANKKKANVAEAPVVPTWRFTGTFRKGSQQIALIETGKDKHILRVLPGDELPGGGKVTAVRIGELAYTDSAGEQVLKLFDSDKSSLAAGERKN